MLSHEDLFAMLTHAGSRSCSAPRHSGLGPDPHDRTIPARGRLVRLAGCGGVRDRVRLPRVSGAGRPFRGTPAETTRGRPAAAMSCRARPPSCSASRRPSYAASTPQASRPPPAPRAVIAATRATSSTASSPCASSPSRGPPSPAPPRSWTRSRRGGRRPGDLDAALEGAAGPRSWSWSAPAESARSPFLDPCSSVAVDYRARRPLLASGRGLQRSPRVAAPAATVTGILMLCAAELAVQGLVVRAA